MQDQEITCIGPSRENPCPYGATFTHSVKDQEFYQRQGFEAPKRCRECREAKKAMKATQGGGNDRYEDHSERRGHRENHRSNRFSSDREMLGYGSEE